MTSKLERIIMLGSLKVGKTSLLHKYFERTFRREYTATIEDFYTHVAEFPGGAKHAIEIVDTSGSDEFPAMRELRITQGTMFVVVFAVDDMFSLDCAVKLCKDVFRFKGSSDVPLLLVGNKIDSKKREISSNVIARAADNIGVPYTESSAKGGSNIHGIFTTLLTMFLERKDGGGARALSPEDKTSGGLSISEKLKGTFSILRSNTYPRFPPEQLKRIRSRYRRQESNIDKHTEMSEPGVNVSNDPPSQVTPQ